MQIILYIIDLKLKQKTSKTAEQPTEHFSLTATEAFQLQLNKHSGQK